MQRRRAVGDHEQGAPARKAPGETAAPDSGACPELVVRFAPRDRGNRTTASNAGTPAGADLKAAVLPELRPQACANVDQADAGAAGVRGAEANAVVRDADEQPRALGIGADADAAAVRSPCKPGA